MAVFLESVPDPVAFKELCSMTDLALCATKMTAQAIGKSMASLLLLERHLWLSCTTDLRCLVIPNFANSQCFVDRVWKGLIDTRFLSRGGGGGGGGLVVLV